MYFHWPLRRLSRWIAVGLFSYFLSLCLGTAAYGQFSFLDDGSVVETNLPPADVVRYGTLEVTWVKSPISGENLFQIAAPAISNRNDLMSEQMTVEVRADIIEDLLWLETTRFRERAVDRLLGRSLEEAPRSAQVVVSTLKSLPVIQVLNYRNGRALTLATITQEDANFYSEEPAKIAAQWQATLQKEVSNVEEIYSPMSFRQRIEKTLGILLSIVLISFVLGFVRSQFFKRQRSLQAKRNADIEAAAAEQSILDQKTVETVSDDVQAPPSSAAAAFRVNSRNEQIEHSRFTDFVRRQFSQSRWLDFYKFVRWFLFWAIVVVWYLGIYLATTQLPILMRWSSKVLTQPLSLIAIWFFVSFVVRISHTLIQRSLSMWQENAYLSFGDARRKAVRSHTIAGAVQGLSTCVLVLLGILLTLIEFGLPASSIFAGSALLGLALSFGAQNLVKDLVNGCLILLEDQFAIGDYIVTNGEEGFVEKLNLRLTQLRSYDGELISIPNSSISLVKNQTSSWARVNLGIDVAYDTDLDRAIAVIQETACQMSQDAKWRSLILEAPQVLGVDSFGDNSITIRLWMRTDPLQKRPIARELRRRLKKAFDAADISIPFPQRSIWFENVLSTQHADRAKPARQQDVIPAQHSTQDS